MKIYKYISSGFFFFFVSMAAVSPASSVRQGAEESNTENSALAEVEMPGPSFGYDEVIGEARAAAERPFQAPDSQLTAYLRGLSEADWNNIKFEEEHRLWRGQDLSFEAGFFHPGFIYDQPVTINVVEEGAARVLPFVDGWFKPAAPPPGRASSLLNYAGFRLNYPLNSPDKSDELLSFLGATHFRALARQTVYGLTARGLIINPALADGEEFPYFRKFWLVKPEPEASVMSFYALLESPSLTGAYHFQVRPGTSTVMEVNCRLFLRNGATRPRKIGLAPLSSMYLFSEKENGSRNDYRPEVHSSDTLLYSDLEGTWYNFPLGNPERLEVKEFPLNSPKGFGLIQSDASFDHYQDLQARFDRRPSLWVEPLGDWGPGRLELIEIPSTQEIHDNILAFWVTDSPFTAENAGTAGSPQEDLRFDYRLYWMAPAVVPHQLGRVVATRQVQSPKRDSIQFLIDFESEELNAITAETGLASVVEVGPEAVVNEKILLKNPVTGGWRLEFKVYPPQDGGVMQSLMSARGERRWLRLKAFLKKGENLSEPLTETWTYDLPY